MNVLFYRYNSLCESIYINALTSLGINVIEERTEMTNKSVSGEDSIQNVRRIIDSEKILFVMSINYYPHLSAICNIYHIPYVSIIVDSPVWELYTDTIKNPYNRIFIFDRALYLRHVNDNPDCIFHMPLCADIPHISSVLSNNDRNSFKCDVSFIGSLYTEKCPYNQVNNLPDYMKGYFEGIIKSSMLLYGKSIIYDMLDDSMVSDFMKYTDVYRFPERAKSDYKAVVAYNYLAIKASEQERIKLLSSISNRFSLDIYTRSDTSMMPNAHNKGFASSLTEMPLIFANSKINLQITAKTIETGLSQRVFDVLASGGFLLMNYQEEIFDYFVPGEDLDFFGCEEELLEKIEFYLKNDDIRRAIATSGKLKSEKFHSPITRMNEIIKRL